MTQEEILDVLISMVQTTVDELYDELHGFDSCVGGSESNTVKIDDENYTMEVEAFWEKAKYYTYKITKDDGTVLKEETYNEFS